MKTAFLLSWLAVPVVWAAWHYGPGQDAIKRDRSDNALAEVATFLGNEDYEAAVAACDAALKALPKEEIAQSRRIRLARARALVDGHQLPVGHRELEALYQELSDDATAEPAVLNGTRESLASAKYYLTWLMRLEGLPREEWEPEIENARQHFRYLAEQPENLIASADHQRWQENLESAIRLGRMDLAELQGLPLPSQ